MIISEMEIRLAANIARLQQGMDAARRTVSNAVSSMSATVERFKTLLAGIGVGIGLKELASQVIGAQREFDKLHSSLITATGSSEKADKAFAALQRFAASTPYDLKQTTEAFLKLRNMGLDPSERALRSYGNTAGALGKSLDQMVEAVADAATGEFERLKEFGIKASQNGATVALSFQGVTTQVANNARAIQDYLLALGETKFAGGMELQAKTLDGAISNLGDSWQGLMRSISQSGVGSGAQSVVKQLADALDNLSGQIRDGGPVVEGLKLVTKLTAAYLAVMSATWIIVAFGGALGTIALNLSLIKLELRAGLGLWGLFNVALTGTSVQAALAAGSLTKLQLAGSLLFAAFAGWEIGKYLDENFVQARVAGEVFVGAMLTGWENIKYAGQMTWLAIKSAYNEVIGGMTKAFAGFLELNAKGLSLVGATETAKGIQDYATQLRSAVDAQMDFSRASSLLTAAHEKRIELIEAETDARVASAVIAANVSEADRQQTGNALAGIDAKTEATKEALDWYKKTVESSRSAYEALTVELLAEHDLSAEEKKRAEVLAELARAGKSLSAVQKQEITDYLNANVVLARTIALQKEEMELRDQRIADARSQVAAAEGQTRSLEDQIKYYGLTEEAVLKLKAAELDRQLQSDSIDGIERGRLEGLLEETQNQIALQTKLTKMKADTTFWTNLEDVAHQTFLSIQDGGKNLWQRLKDSAQNIFFEWLYQMTVKKWIINIGTSFSGESAVSGIAGALSGGSGSSGGLGAFGTVSNLYSAGKTIYQGFSTGLTSTMGGYITQFGNMIGSSTVSGFGMGASGWGTMAEAYAPSGAVAAGASFAKAIPIIGWIIAGMQAADTFMKQGFTPNNGTLNGVGQAIGAPTNFEYKSVQWLGMNKTLANILSGAAINTKLFGRADPVIESQGLRGTINAGGIDAQAYANILEKGGLFRSSKRYEKTAVLSAENDAQFDDTIKAMITAVKGFGSALRIETTKIDAYTKVFDVKLTGDEAKDKEVITKLFSDVADELSVSLVPTLTKFAAEGELASVTLQRLVTDYVSVDAMFVAVGKALMVTGEAGIAARENLIAAAGGLDALTSKMEFFQQNILTEAERLAPVQKQVAEQMAALGYANVKTTEQFKDAALAIDTNTKEGAELFAALLTLAPQFKVVADAAAAAAKEVADAAAAAAKAAQEAAAQAAKDRITVLLSNVDAAFSALEKVVGREKAAKAAAHEAEMKALQERMDASTATIAKRQALSSSLNSTLDQLKASGTADADARVVGQAQIQAALVIARAGGGLPDADSLKSALAAVTADASAQFATYDDYLADLYKTQNDIAALGKITDASLSVEQKTLDLLQSQKDVSQAAYDAEVARLDGILENAQDQVDALKGIDVSVLTVNQTLAALASALTAAQANPTLGSLSGITKAYQDGLGRAPDKAGLDYWSGVAGTGTSVADIAQQIANSPEAKIQSLYKSLFGRAGDAAGIDYWISELNGGMSLDNIKSLMKESAEYKSLHSFAVGTNRVPFDMTANIHADERIIPAADNRELMARLSNPAPSFDEMLAEMRAQRAENQSMHESLAAHLYAIAKNTLNSADVLEGAANGDLSLAGLGKEEE